MILRVVLGSLGLADGWAGASFFLPGFCLVRPGSQPFLFPTVGGQTGSLVGKWHTLPGLLGIFF